MSVFYVDTHCHLDLVQNIQLQVPFEDRQPIKTITVTNAPNFFSPNKELFKDAKNIRVALGFHPELSTQFASHLDVFFTEIDKAKYIGEIGLDGSARFRQTFPLQLEIFEKILDQISSMSDKILTVHTRGAAPEVLRLLKEYNIPMINKVIFHWFSGDLKTLQEAANAGVYFSVNHKMLQSKNGIEILKNIPRNLLLTETDAPFTFDSAIKTRLASLELTCKQISETFGVKEEIVRSEIWDNFRTLLK